MTMSKKNPSFRDLGVHMFEADALDFINHVLPAFKACTNVVINRPKSILDELRVYRKHVPVLLQYYGKVAEVLNMSAEATQRLDKSNPDNARRKWTEKEDNLLIEEVCKDDANLAKLAIMFGRSPGALQSRITHLVGVKKISQAIAGKFVGKIDGVLTESDIAGVVYKE